MGKLVINHNLVTPQKLQPLTIPEGISTIIG